ncbi:MAG: gamma carbonic anhydrase family protein [Fibrobacterota bacterium]
MAVDITNDFHIHPSVYIAPGARLYGKITIGANSNIWDGAVLRGDFAPIIIGENTSIQENCVVHVGMNHPIHIGDNVLIGHGVVIDGATVENNCLIAINSTVLKGAVIKQGSIVGAGAVVMEKEIIPQNSMVYGLPAKVVKETDADRRHFILKATQGYAELAKQYKEQFRNKQIKER